MEVDLRWFRLDRRDGGVVAFGVGVECGGVEETEGLKETVGA